MDTFYLEVGRSGDAGNHKLSLAPPNYVVLADGFQVTADASNPRFSVVTLPLHVKGTTKNDLLNNVAALQTKLDEATIGSDPGGELPWVVFGAQLTGADTEVRWRIVSGTLAGGDITGIQSNWIGSQSQPLQLILRCLSGALGAEIVDDAVTVTGDDPTFYRAAIPGQMPALIEATITDNSTGEVLQRVHVGSRSAGDMASGDLALVKPVTSQSGEETGTDDTISDPFARAGLSSLWSAVGYVQPTERYLRGQFDIWARVRDWSTLLAQPTGVTAEAATGPNIVQLRAPTEAETSGVFGTPRIDTTSITSITVDWKQATKAGNLLILTLHRHGSATDTLPAGWTKAVDKTQGSEYVAMYYKANAASEDGDVTVTFSSAVDAYMTLQEWAGIAEASPLDVTASNGVASGTSHPTGTTAATAQAHSLALGAHTLVTLDDDRGLTNSFKRIFSYNSFGPDAYAASKTLTATGTTGYTLSNDSSSSASANVIAVFKAATAAGDLESGSYQYRVAALDANDVNSYVSATVSMTQPSSNTNRATQLTWDEPAGATPDDYRVFWKKDSRDWQYLDTGSTDPTFYHNTETGATTATPPTDGSSPAQVRLALSLGSGQTVVAHTRTVTPAHANGDWEWLLLGTEQLPPMAAPLSAAQQSYRLGAEVKHAVNDDDFDLDVLVLVPAGEAQFTAEALEELTTAREWIIGTNEGGHAYGYLLDDSSDEIGQVNVQGQLMAGPGDTRFAVLMQAADHVAQVEGMSLSVVLKITPIYEWLAGSQ